MTESMSQLNITFNPLEDRLLLRISAGDQNSISEYRIWLTRRYVKLLWKTLDQILEDDISSVPGVSGEAKKALLQFQQDTTLSEANFSVPYAAETLKDVVMPLGHDPLLVSKIKITKGPKNTQIVNFITEDGKSVNLTIATKLAHSIKKLLIEMDKKAQWGLNLSLLSHTVDPGNEHSHIIN